MRQTMAGLVDPDRERRRRAVEALEPDRAGLYALRSVLLLDDDATVRASAAARLGRGDGRLAGPWLLEALSDPRPLVRDAACQALARLETAAEPLHRVALGDPEWWVRRAAVRALSSRGLRAGAGLGHVIATLAEALHDPFWRVRHAAVQALAAVGDADPARRAQILGTVVGGPSHVVAAGRFLAERWQGEDDLPVRIPVLWAESGAGRPYDPLDDPDPAVVAAHLLALDTVALEPRRLVPLLASSHEPLRRIAARRLQEINQNSLEGPALEAVLALLEDRRLPRGAAAAGAILDGLGARALPLATSVLARGGEPGALAWACGFAAAHRVTELYQALRRCAGDEDPRVRRAAVRALADVALAELSDGEVLTSLVGAVADADPRVREAAIRGLLALERTQALASLPFGDQPPAIRCLLLVAAGCDGDRGRLIEGAADGTTEVRAAALGQLAALGWLSEDLRRQALQDPDPWIRRAALGSDVPAVVQLHLLERDVDPWVLREAMRGLCRDRRQLSDVERCQVVELTAGAEDPWLRARCCELLVLDGDTMDHAALRVALALSHDRSPMVRAAAADVLEPRADLAARLRELLARQTLTTRERVAAFSYLLRDRDEGAREELTRALTDPAQPPEVVEHLEAISLLFDAPPQVRAVPARSTEAAAAAPAKEIPRRSLGRDGPEVAPLAVSGVYQLAPGALAVAAEAGVNLFFWEPRHTNLTRFLRGRRRRDLRVIAGTFNAHRDGIEHDLELALRRLGRERIDVFLLFWARSAARLSRDSFELLQRLRGAGKIGATGFSTHDRELAATALEQHPWDVVMVRHSAAHPGAEERLLPLARERGVGVLTFSALCYGRLLRPVEGAPGDPPKAADCYRYSLSQPGVTACISAPRRFRELSHNLEVLAAPTLDEAAAAALREHGALVHRENRRFDRLLRRGEAGLVEPEVASVELPTDSEQPGPRLFEP